MRAHGSERTIGGLWCQMALVVVVAAGGLLGGCNSGSKATVADLRVENEELRDRNEQVERALDDCESARVSIEREREELIAENARLRGEMSDGALTGFEGVSGASVSTRVGEIAVEVAGDVLFSSGSVTLKNSAKGTLDQIAKVIKSQYPGNEIRIAGHTDSDKIRKSKWKTNERLSAERALAVEEFLVSKGLGKDKLHIAGYGSAKPRGSKKQSRRVEIVILASAG